MTNKYFNYGSFMRDPELKVDGSNFADWYQRLRDILTVNDLLFVIEEPLGIEPGDFVSMDEYEEFCDRRDTYIEVQCTMLYSMESDLRTRFFNDYPDEMVLGLKALFISQVRIMKHEWLDKFLSQKMEENTCLDSHLAIMH